MTKRPKGFFTGAEADARAGRASMSPGTHHGGGGRSGPPGLDTRATHIPTQPKQKTTIGDGVSSFINKLPSVRFGKWGAKKIRNIFQNKATYEKTEHRGLRQNLETGAYEHHAPTHISPVGGKDGNGMAQGATPTQSLVTAPTADKGAGFGHQWNFQAYGNQTQTAANPYDYTKAPYAKKGKLIRKYGTGQEIKNFSKGKRFGPPPLKGPDPQGLQVILENSDYFKKLIG